MKKAFCMHMIPAFFLKNKNRNKRNLFRCGRGTRTRTLGTRFWRQCHIKRTVQIVPTAPPFVLLALLNLMPFDALLMLCKNLIKFDAQLPKKSTLVILFKYNIHSVKLHIESNGIARVRRQNKLRWN